MTTSRSLSEFLLEQAIINNEQLKTALTFQKSRADSAREAPVAYAGEQDSPKKVKREEIGLGDALVHTGALSAKQLEPYLTAYKRSLCGPMEFLPTLLSDRPRSEVLEVMTKQLMQSLVSTVGGQLAVDGCHAEVDKVAPCEYTIYQAFTGDFRGEVYLNISASWMLQISSTLAVNQADSVSALVADGACEFLNIVNGQVCAKLSEMGMKVGLKRPLFFRHPYWGERVGAPFDLAGRIGESAFTSVTLAHPIGRQEMCIVDRTGLRK